MSPQIKSSLPESSRKNGINEKLRYAETQRLLLGERIIASYKNEGELPEFVSLTAESILSNARECFDHLGKDIVEGHLLKKLKNPIAKKYQDGKIKSYFPFYPGQLTKRHQLFSNCKLINRELYDELSNFINAIENKKNITNTSFNTRDFRIIQEMVNAKKHSHVLEYNAHKNEKVFVGGNEGSFIFDEGFRNDDPNLTILLPKNAEKRKVPSYRFACNGLDVFNLCLFATKATAIVIDTFYDKFFIPTEPVFIPEPAPIITTSSCPSGDFEHCSEKNIIDL